VLVTITSRILQVEMDESLDEMASYFNRETVPKVLITTSDRPSQVRSLITSLSSNVLYRQPAFHFIYFVSIRRCKFYFCLNYCKVKSCTRHVKYKVLMSSYSYLTYSHIGNFRFLGSNIENFNSYSLYADDSQRAVAVEKDVSLVLMVIVVSLLLLCEENKQVLQRTEEMRS